VAPIIAAAFPGLSGGASGIPGRRSPC
jgi:hypothetical protein